MMEDELRSSVAMGKVLPEVDLRQLRLSCVSMAVEAVNKDPDATLMAVMPLAEKMYKWVKNG